MGLSVIFNIVVKDLGVMLLVGNIVVVDKM